MSAKKARHLDQLVARSTSAHQMAVCRHRHKLARKLALLCLRSASQALCLREPAVLAEEVHPGMVFLDQRCSSRYKQHGWHAWLPQDRRELCVQRL